MTIQDAKRRVALMTWGLIESRLRLYDDLFEDLTDPDIERITEAINRLSEEMARRAGPEMDKLRGWRPREEVIRSCRSCGCTDVDCRECIERTGHPCHWVEADLCSACVEPS